VTAIAPHGAAVRADSRDRQRQRVAEGSHVRADSRLGAISKRRHRPHRAVSSPLYGRGDGLGWDFGQDATIAELLDFIRPTPEVGFISALTIEPTMPPYVDAAAPISTQRPFSFGNAGVWVQLADYEIVCSYNRARGHGHQI